MTRRMVRSLFSSTRFVSFDLELTFFRPTFLLPQVTGSPLPSPTLLVRMLLGVDLGLSAPFPSFSVHFFARSFELEPTFSPSFPTFVRPLISNPEYKGKWSAPLIDNPKYKGVWAPQKIANPDYFEDLEPAKGLTAIGGVGFEIWTMTEDMLCKLTFLSFVFITTRDGRLT